jgi:hypothetical protein
MGACSAGRSRSPSSGTGRLADADRDVLLLVALAGLSYAETGFARSIPEGTVASRLNRARRRLVSALGGTDPTSIFNERQDVTPRSQHPGPPNSTAPPGAANQARLHVSVPAVYTRGAGPHAPGRTG